MKVGKHSCCCPSDVKQIKVGELIQLCLPFSALLVVSAVPLSAVCPETVVVPRSLPEKEIDGIFFISHSLRLGEFAYCEHKASPYLMTAVAETGTML